MVIDKWTFEEEDDLYEWSHKVIQKMEETSYSEGRIVPLKLERDAIEDDIVMGLDIFNRFFIDFGEGLHETTDMRDKNIGFIKKFVSEEMPYLEFMKQRESYDGEYGFRLVYRVKESE